MLYLKSTAAAIREFWNYVLSIFDEHTDILPFNKDNFTGYPEDAYYDR